MKKLMGTLLLSFHVGVTCYSYSISAVNGGNIADNKKIDVCYWAILLNGKMRLFVDGRQVYTDVKQALGRKITTEGVLIYPNGSTLLLKNGECITHELDESFEKISQINNTKEI